MPNLAHTNLRACLTLVACAGVLFLALAGCASSVPNTTTQPDSVGPDGPISWAEASSRIGELLSAEGPVSSVRHHGGDVLLNLGTDAPDPTRLVVVIPASARDKFPADAASAYQDRLVTATGTIVSRDGVATIVVRKPVDLKIE